MHRSDLAEINRAVISRVVGLSATEPSTSNVSEDDDPSGTARAARCQSTRRIGGIS